MPVGLRFTCRKSLNLLQHSATVPYKPDGDDRIADLPDIEKVGLSTRVGFAYSPFGNKAVFRGGVGLFSDLYPGTLLNLFYAKLPGGYHVFTDDGGPFHAPARTGGYF